MNERVLFVCTGNICRSPIGEVLLRSAPGLPDGAVVGSAGLLFEGREASDGAVAWGDRVGIDLRCHRSRVISTELIEEQDLILGMEPQHVREVVALSDRAWSYTYTLRELASRVDRVGPRREDESVSGYLSRVSEGRKRLDLMTDTTGLSIADPYQLSAETYDQTAADIATALLAVTGAIWPRGTASETQTARSA